MGFIACAKALMEIGEDIDLVQLREAGESLDICFKKPGGLLSDFGKELFEGGSDMFNAIFNDSGYSELAALKLWEQMRMAEKKRTEAKVV